MFTRLGTARRVQRVEVWGYLMLHQRFGQSGLAKPAITSHIYPRGKLLVKPTIPYLIVGALSEAQIQQLHALYQDEWWTAGRSLADVRTVLQYSDFVFGVVTADSQELVGFTRVLTDRVYKAVLFDVIVHSKHRGAGLGSFLLTHILQHPVLSRVAHVELYCLPERREFYRRHGFTDALGELQLMRRVKECK